MAARTEIISEGQNMPGGSVKKNGFVYAEGTTEMYAAWPMYAMRRHGYARQSHDS